MNKIHDLIQIQKILLDIALIVRDILGRHNINLCLIGGSLLGAVRHKGFIPWDDDMDFVVPYEKYEEILAILNQELPYPYEVVTYKTHKSCHSAFAKVQDKRTCLNDKSSYGKLEDNLGINIDLFPVKLVDEKDPLIVKLHRYRLKCRMTFARDIYERWYVEPAKHILRLFCTKSEEQAIDKQWELAKRIKVGDTAYSLFGVYSLSKELMVDNYFAELTAYYFEGQLFMGPSNADGCLRHYYGDYMTLPAEEKRVWHNDGVYFRDDITI